MHINLTTRPAPCPPLQIEHWDEAKQAVVRDFYAGFFFSARDRAMELMTGLWLAGGG
jgi:hypothetical protein